MEGTVYSLIPPLVMLVLVLLTRRVILSLGSGIVVGALMLHDFNVLATLKSIWENFYTIFYSIQDGLAVGNIQLFLFLILLGITTAFMTASGGSLAFGNWAIRRVKSRKGAQLVPAFLGIVIFIDDYFNSLAVGQVARPLTDRYKVSRAKLAYIIDSTSAPITVISPISSWGAFIIGIIGTQVLTPNNITEYSSFEAFVKMIPMNLYVFAAMFLVFLTVLRSYNIGSMKKHENLAMEEGKLFDATKTIPGDLNNEFVETDKGKISHLLVPIVVLIVATVSTMIYTGMQGTEGAASLLDIFKNTNVNQSLFTGGVSSVVVALIMYLTLSGNKSPINKVLMEGTKAMLPAIYILVFAWMIGTVIESIGTGEYLADLVRESSISASYLPLIIFLVASLMAFATGTSWGTFGMMLPIAGEIAANTDMNVFLPSLAAVLAGSVFGDHCSPISDTSILSSTGAGSNHIDHVMTQLPYALIGAVGTIVGYVIFALTSSVLLSLFATLAIVAIFVFLTPSPSNSSKETIAS
ncbi:Na+/H+ antiporter NhaC family protein [Pontibacillus halophilus]|nr:Na+/H+ antiporter NhaC family protein [Pontibacillus halophilus]